MKIELQNGCNQKLKEISTFTKTKIMDIINFFEALVQHWNNENTLNRDWEFGAVLTDDAVNRYKLRRDDSVVIFLTNLNINPSTSFNSTGNALRYIERWSFNLRVITHDKLARNNYNEIPQHEILESRWYNTLRPLKDLLVMENVLDFCVIYGTDPVRITAWNMTPLINWQDNNYTGWDIRVTLEFDR